MKKSYILTSVLLLVLISKITLSQTIFTSSGTYTVPAGVDTIIVEMVGPGGAGGVDGGGGGGGGGYAIGAFIVVPLSVHQVTVGAGGSGITTSISGLPIMASAGANGADTLNPYLGGGGIGGVGSGGLINRNGGMGGGGYYTYFGGGGGGAGGSVGNGSAGGNTVVWNTTNCLTPGGAGGAGGGAPGGDGGKGAGFTDNNCSVTNPSGNGMNYGGGGGGANGNGGAQGTGAGGYCKITTSLSTGFASILSTVNIQVLTNPFTDKIIIKNGDGTLIYKLTNSLGQEIWNGRNIEQKDFSYLDKGMYILNVVSPNVMKSFNLIKQ